MADGFTISRRTLLGGIMVGARAATSANQVRAADPTWTRLPGDGPAARWDHSLSANGDRKELLLFGGRDAAGAALGDSWIYDLADRSWRPIEASGPSPRFGHAVVFDPAQQRMLLFGGQSADQFFNDVWALSTESLTWKRLNGGAGVAPSPRYGLSAVIANDARLIVSHGFTFDGRFDDTWAFDLVSNAWSNISPDDGAPRPLKRCLHEQIWHAETGAMLLYGGCSSGFGPCPQGDLWRFDPAARRWTELTPVEGPAARSNPALVADDRGDRSILVGGLTEAGYVDDVWFGSLNEGAVSWSKLTLSGEAPSPRASHDAVLARGDVYIFGGIGNSGVTADLWKLSLS